MKMHKRIFSFVTVLLGFLGVLTLSGCGGEAERAATGTASFDITDAPADDVTQVRLTISAIALKPNNGELQRIEFESPVVIDNLLALQGGNFAELLPDQTFPAGEYNWLRLYIIGGGADSWVMTDEGGQVDLFVPGQQSANGQSRHVQLVSGFVIPAGGDVDFTIDVDLRKALTKPAGKDYYLLRPAMRITDNSNIGSISGTVADALVTDDSCNNDLINDEGNAVYLYRGADAVAGDVYVDDMGAEIGGDNPLAVANVKQNQGSGFYEYSFGFIPEGAYTVAFTCNALDDMPDADDDLAFAQSANIEVDAGDNAEYDFEAAPEVALP